LTEVSLGLLGLAIALFASTNVDDAFLLVTFFSNPKFRPRDIVIGQYAGITTLFAIGLLGSLLALVVSRPYIGLIGFVTIGIGIKRLFDLYRYQDQEAEAWDTQHPNKHQHTRIATVALLTLASGADNIGTYIPAFAIRSRLEILMFAVVFAAMTALWCLFAHWMVHHPTLGKPVRHYGRRLAPVVLIAIGVSVMYSAGTLHLLLHGRN
jgi:cadmium resistance protein CadD (predicted permease)